MPNYVTHELTINMSKSDFISKFCSKIDNSDCFDFNRLVPMSEKLLIAAASYCNSAERLYALVNKHRKQRMFYADLDINDCFSKQNRLYHIKSIFNKNEDVHKFMPATVFLMTLIDEHNSVALTADIESTLTLFVEPSDVTLSYTDALDDDKKSKLLGCVLAYELGKIYTENEQNYGYSTWYEWRKVNWGTKWNVLNCDIKSVDDATTKVTFNTTWSAPVPIFEKLAENGIAFSVDWADEQFGYDTGSFVFDGTNTTITYYDDCSDEANAIATKIHGIQDDDDDEE